MDKIVASINRTELMRLLRISDITAEAWERSKFLVPTHTKLEALYETSAVDEMLAANAHNFNTPPTLAAIASGELELMLLHEVLKLLGHGRDTLMNRVQQQGVIAAIQFGDHWRYSRKSIKEYVTAYAKSRELHISRADAATIMGVTKRTLIAQVIVTRRVQCAGVSIQWGGTKPLLRDSFMALLRELLPGWITPEEWIAERYVSKHALLSSRKVEELLGLDHHGGMLAELLEDKELRHIYTPGGEKGKRRLLVTYESVLAHLHHWPILDDNDLSAIFATPVAAVRNWRAQGRLGCVLHPQHRFALRQACVIGILRQWLTGRISARTWYYARIDRPGSALDEHAAAQLLGWPAERVRAQAEAGKIKGLHLPNSSWRFSPDQISDIRRDKT